jgi:hypothetical protein
VYRNNAMVAKIEEKNEELLQIEKARKSSPKVKKIARKAKKETAESALKPILELIKKS